MKVLIAAYITILLFSSCSKKQPAASPLFTNLQAEKTGIYFNNKLTPNADLNILEYDYFYNGGGVAAADFDNDGLTDLFFTGNQVSSCLYLNKGGLVFTDITREAGLKTTNWATGVAVADVNNDGWKDVYICYSQSKEGAKRTHQLFINQRLNSNGIPTFKEEAAACGLADTSFSSNAVFIDYDRDGDLDMYLVNHDRIRQNPNYPAIKKNDGTARSTDKLFRNDVKNGRPYFTDVSHQTGITHEGYGLSASVADVNNDGWPDIYVCNDFTYDDLLYLNNKDGTFIESIHHVMNHTSRFSMGSDIADFNNDGQPDIVTVDMLPDDNERQKLMNAGSNNDLFNLSLSNGYLPQYSRNMLQLNNGPDSKGQISFSEIGQLAGIDKTDWSWSTLFVDLDNDGYKDLFITNGIPKDITNIDLVAYWEQSTQGNYNYDIVKKGFNEKVDILKAVDKPNVVFANTGNLSFTDKSEAWGLNKKGFSNGAIYADLDNDGDLDLVTNNINEQASVFINHSELQNKNNFLRIKLNGPYANNAKISCYTKGARQLVEYSNAHGFQSSQEEVAHFGMGKNTLVDSLVIIWLNGKSQTINNPVANKLLSITYADSSTSFVPAKNIATAAPTLFNDITDNTGINFTHIENEFEDVNFEPLLPHRFSRNGPAIAVADIDGNGYEDFWIGGPAKIQGKLFLQQPDGSFIIRQMPEAEYEDMGGVFFDADGDGDMDLYVVSGGNEYAVNSTGYQDRLYINNGKGNLNLNIEALPMETASGSYVIPCDFDKDGDIDLFVGGRVLPGSYPFPAQSFILSNNGKGQFENVTSKVCPGLGKAGLVTAALWTDFDNDGWTDLIITGEWMPVTFYKNNKGKFERVGNENDINNTGWWFSIAAGDFDKDGDTDYIVGNLGQNNKYKADNKHPVSVYAKDFDGNGSKESILTYYIGNNEYPVPGRDQLASVLPSIKKKFDTYAKYAAQPFPGIFSNSELDDALILKATNLSTCYFENKGKGQFIVHPLPVQAQFSAVQSICVGDFNNDTNPDILLGGNFYSPDFMTGQYDASNGFVLTGDGKGNFKPVESSNSGIFFKGDTRSLANIKWRNKNAVIVLANSGKLAVYSLH